MSTIYKLNGADFKNTNLPFLGGEYLLKSLYGAWSFATSKTELSRSIINLIAVNNPSFHANGGLITDYATSQGFSFDNNLPKQTEATFLVVAKLNLKDLAAPSADATGGALLICSNFKNPPVSGFGLHFDVRINANGTTSISPNAHYHYKTTETTAVNQLVGTGALTTYTVSNDMPWLLLVGRYGRDPETGKVTVSLSKPLSQNMVKNVTPDGKFDPYYAFKETTKTQFGKTAAFTNAATAGNTYLSTTTKVLILEGACWNRFLTDAEVVFQANLVKQRLTNLGYSVA